MGPIVLERARTLAAGRSRPVAVIASGETTVKVVGKGKGGRNQEMALSVAENACGRFDRHGDGQHGHRWHRRPDRRGRRVRRYDHYCARSSAGSRPRGVSGRQQRLRLFRAPQRSHHHRSLDDERRRSSSRPFPVSLRQPNLSRIPTHIQATTMLSREQILKLMRDKVTHPDDTSRTHQDTQDSPRRARHVPSTDEGARDHGRAGADQRWTRRVARQDGSCRRPPPDTYLRISALSFPIRQATTRLTCTSPRATSRRRCTAIACSSGSSVARSRTAWRGASSASSSAAIPRSSADSS